MHSTGMFAKLVFYMDACYSGSMFQGLPSNINVYATTAASPIEPSFGAYCPPADTVAGRELISVI